MKEDSGAELCHDSQRARRRWAKLRNAILGNTTSDGRDLTDGGQKQLCDDYFSVALTKKQNLSRETANMLMNEDDRLKIIRVSKPRINSKECSSMSDLDEGGKNNIADCGYIRSQYARFVLKLSLLVQAQCCCRKVLTERVANTQRVSLIAAGNAISTAIDVSEYLLRRGYVDAVSRILTDSSSLTNEAKRGYDKEIDTLTATIQIQLDVKSVKSIILDSDYSCSPNVFSLSQAEDDDGQFACMEYIISLHRLKSPSTSLSYNKIHILTRERQHQGKISLRELVSERHVNVDNTGNVHVWDASSVLAYSLINSNVSKEAVADGIFGIDNILKLAHIRSIGNESSLDTKQVKKTRKLSVIELGCGMAGLAGLAVGAAQMSGYVSSYDANTSIEVLLSDGHPCSVQNNMLNATLTSAYYNAMQSGNVIRSQPLQWKDDDDGARECAHLTRRRYFQLCLVSDCLYFQKFHGALAATIGRLLEINGVCVLCQPPRGNSLRNFIALLDYINDEKPLFDVRLLKDYNEDVTKIRKRLEEEQGSKIAPDKIFPVMLILRKKRPYIEREDTMRVVKHMNARSQNKDEKHSPINESN